jgi:hypothetical protein
VNLLVKGALIGGAVGGGIAALQASRRPADTARGSTRPVVPAVGKGVVEGVLAGGVVGLVLDVRARRRAAVLAGEGLLIGRRLARRAGPALDSARESMAEGFHATEEAFATSVLPAVSSATERALGAIGEALSDAAAAGRPAAEIVQAGRVAAQEAVVDAFHVARPAVGAAVGSAVEGARNRASAVVA